MSGWDADERRARDAWETTPAPDGLRERYRTAVASGAAPRRTLRPLALGLAFAVLLAAAGIGVGAHRLASRSSTSTPPAPSHAPQVSTPPPSPSPAPTALNASTWVARHLDGGTVVDMALGPTAIYALVTAPGVSGDVRQSTELVSIDRDSGAARTSTPMTLATSVVVAGRDVWVGVGGSAGGASAPAQVLRLDPATLQPLSTTALRTTGPSAGGPDVTVHLTVGAGTVWAVYGPDLFALGIDGGGAVARTVALGGTVTAEDVAVSPRGDVVYTSAEDPATQTSVLDEWDTATARHVAGAHAVVQGLGPLRLATTGAGVWTTIASGTQASLSFRAAADLAANPPPGGASEHSNQVRAVAAGGVLWVLDAQTLSCADPATGAVRASTSAQGLVTVVADAAATYLGSTSGVDLLAPDPRCGT